MKKITLIILAGGLLILNSCTKTGSQGPAGAQGAQGAAGNANVIGNNKTVAIPATKWTLTGATYSATVSDPGITSDIFSNGVVEVYEQAIIGSITTWTDLPAINGVTSTVFNFYVGGFTIYIQNSDGTTPLAPGNLTFRDVLISASARMAHPNTDWSNYNEAMAALSAASVPASGN